MQFHKMSETNMENTDVSSGPLMSYSDVETENQWNSIVLGNGFSVNIHNGFNYANLYDEARFSESTKNLFEEFNTWNFELVLETLRDAQRVGSVLGIEQDSINDHYLDVQNALFRAVENRHIDWGDFSDRAEKVIAESLIKYQKVFTTNYDLCLYWAIVDQQQTHSTKDFFWGIDGTFDPGDVLVPGAVHYSQIFYLHGGLHLWESMDGRVGKWRSKKEGSLSNVTSKYESGNYPDRHPLFVSEGKSEEKLAKILQSDYLRFCYNNLKNNSGNCVILGMSLGESDSHIVEAIRSSASQNLAVGIYNDGDIDSTNRKIRDMEGKFPNKNLVFFDSSTHPATSPGAKCN